MHLNLHLQHLQLSRGELSTSLFSSATFFSFPNADLYASPIKRWMHLRFSPLLLATASPEFGCAEEPALADGTDRAACVDVAVPLGAYKAMLLGSCVLACCALTNSFAGSRW